MAKPVDSSQTKDKKKGNTQTKTNGSPECAHAPIPPDGGWGWVVTFASFIVGVLVDGICFTFGFFLNDFQTYFNANKSTTSTVSSVLNGTYLSLGPIAGALVNRFGCRKVAIAGAIIASISFFLCTFSPNIQTMIVLYGLCGGIGFGLTYLPAIVMVGYYFDKKRALATGIAVCGSGIGSFVFAPLSEFLLQTYDWKRAMWIISALVLNGVVCSALFRPLEYIEEETVEEDNVIFDRQDVAVPPHVKELRMLKESPIYRCRSLEMCHKSLNNVKETARLGHSLVLNEAVGPTKKHKIVLNPLERKDIFYSGSIQNLPEFKKAGNEENFVRSMLSLNDSKSSLASESKRNVCSVIFKDMFDFSLLKSPTFVVYVFSCFLCMIGFFVPLVYIPDIAKQHGMTTSQSAWCISSIGIINTVGRLLVGYIADKPWMDSIILNNVCLIVGGVATMFVPYMNVFGLLLPYSLVFGFSIATFVSLRSIIIVELLGIEKLTNSFGLVIMSQGLSTFIGSPIAGALYDLTGDFRASFYLAGAVMAMSGVICIPLRRINRWETDRDKERKRREEHEVTKMLP